MTGLVGASLRPSSTATTDGERLAAVAAAVHDPLWLLGRQLQTGELIAEDGGTPVTVTMRQVHAPLVIAGRAATSQVEPLVEAEPVPPPDRLDTATRVRMASELSRLLADANLPDARARAVRAALAAAYPLVGAGEKATYAAYRGRVPDAATLYADWLAALGPAGDSGSLPAVGGLEPADLAALDGPAREWLRWMRGRVGDAGTASGSDAGGPTPAAWSDPLLTYQFTGEARLGGQDVSLRAPDYDGDGVDWHTFDRTPLPAPPDPGPAVVVRPTRVSYPGMPQRGFWTLEDGNVNLDVLAGQDPGRALLVAFAHSYAGDWFLVPLPLAPGVVQVAELTVVDTFGEVTTVSPTAAVDGPATRFRLWELTVDGAGDDVPGMRVLPPSAPPPLEGRVREDVVLARDELANLGWLVELTTTDADGASVDRYQRWLAARPPATETTGEGLRYRLGTTVPDHWYPLEAGEVAPDGSRRLRLAALPDGASEVSDDGVRGRTVRHEPGTEVDEDVVSRAGTRVRRLDRLTYTPTGYVVWRARRRGAGTGEATSGLRFDVVEDGP